MADAAPAAGAAALTAVADRLREALALKDLPRAGWARVGIERPESVAAHSWGVAWLVLALCPPGIDRGRALAIAVLHDLAEVRIGDLTPHDAVAPADKSRAELEALSDMVAPLAAGEEMVALWRELEEGSSPEGRLVKACDKLDMALQAQRYRRRGVDTSEFVDSALTALAALGAGELAALIGQGEQGAG